MRSSAAREVGHGEIWHVGSVDGLDGHVQSVIGQFLGGIADVLEQGEVVLGGFLGGAREKVDVLGLKDAGVLDGTGDAVAELVLASGVCGDATVARGPVTGREVEEGELEVMPGEPFGNVGSRGLVRELHLDAREAGLRGEGEAVEQRHLGEQHRQVCGELRHTVVPFLPDRVNGLVPWVF